MTDKKDSVQPLDNRHWKIEHFIQRMTTKDWAKFLLNNEDRITFKGKLRLLTSKNIGSGVVEVYKEPIKKPGEIMEDFID